MSDTTETPAPDAGEARKAREALLNAIEEELCCISPTFPRGYAHRAARDIMRVYADPFFASQDGEREVTEAMVEAYRAAVRKWEREPGPWDSTEKIRAGLTAALRAGVPEQEGTDDEQ